jgi:ribosomal protein S18 acetylase RimI-like enzyme
VSGGRGLGTGHTLIYRAVQASDFEAVGRLRTLIFSPHLVTIGSQYLQARKYAEALAEKAAVVVAVEADGTLWGAADLASLPCEGGGVCGYITNVCVAPAARRRGIGGRLVDELEMVAARSDMRATVLHVDFDNVAARELYITKGYTLGCDDRELAAAAALVPSAGTESPEQLLMTKLFRVQR